MLRYKTETRPSLVALYDIWPGNGAGPFLQPQNPHAAILTKLGLYMKLATISNCLNLVVLRRLETGSTWGENVWLHLITASA